MNLDDEREMLRILRTRKASPMEEAKLTRLLKQMEDERAAKRKTQAKAAHRPQRAPR